MRNKLSLLVSLAILSIPLTLKAEEHHHGEHEEHEAIEISEQVVKNYNITTMKITSSDIHEVPRSAVVNAQGEYFIYKKENSSFEQVEVEPIEVNSTSVSFHSEEIQPNDEIVNNGAKYLRVILLDKEGGEVGHAH